MEIHHPPLSLIASNCLQLESISFFYSILTVKSLNLQRTPFSIGSSNSGYIDLSSFPIINLSEPPNFNDAYDSLLFSIIIALNWLFKFTFFPLGISFQLDLNFPKLKFINLKVNHISFSQIEGIWSHKGPQNILKESDKKSHKWVMVWDHGHGEMRGRPEGQRAKVRKKVEKDWLRLHYVFWHSCFWTIQ